MATAELDFPTLPPIAWKSGVEQDASKLIDKSDDLASQHSLTTSSHVLELLVEEVRLASDRLFSGLNLRLKSLRNLPLLLSLFLQLLQ